MLWVSSRTISLLCSTKHEKTIIQKSMDSQWSRKEWRFSCIDYVNSVLTGKELPWLVRLPKVNRALEDPQVRSWRVCKFDEHISHMEELLDSRKIDTNNQTYTIWYTVCSPDVIAVRQSDVILHKTIFFPSKHAVRVGRFGCEDWVSVSMLA